MKELPPVGTIMRCNRTFDLYEIVSYSDNNMLYQLMWLSGKWAHKIQKQQYPISEVRRDIIATELTKALL